MILAVAVSSALGLAGCIYGIPPGGWNEPVESPLETSKTPPPPLPVTAKQTGPLASKIQRQMVQVLLKLTNQRSDWLQDGRGYWLLPVGTLDRHDPWGNAYRVWSEIREGSEPQRTCVVLVVASAGPDCQFATNDDIQGESDDLLLLGRKNN
jgi:hypothetical protein